MGKGHAGEGKCAFTCQPVSFVGNFSTLKNFNNSVSNCTSEKMCRELCVFVLSLYMDMYPRYFYFITKCDAQIGYKIQNVCSLRVYMIYLI